MSTSPVDPASVDLPPTEPIDLTWLIADMARPPRAEDATP